MEERELLRAWLQGRHLEDIELINLNYFTPKGKLIAELVQKGLNAFEISKKANVRLDEILSLLEGKFEGLYEVAKNSFLYRALKEKLSDPDASLSEVQNAIEIFKSSTMQTVEADAGWEEAFLKAQIERKNEEIAKFEGLPSLTATMGGIKRKRLTTVAARPSVGKSAFGLQIALGVATKGTERKVLYFPLEMTKEETFDRMLAHERWASSEELRDGSLDDVKKQRCAGYLDSVYKRGNLKIYEGCGKYEDIERLVETEKPFLIIIDQLKQMRSDKTFNSVRERYDYMTSNLKALAMRENVAVMLLCQISRAGENVEPTLSMLKESGSIEEDSDNVIILHTIPKEQWAEPLHRALSNSERALLIKLAKHRGGELSENIVRFTPSRSLFTEIAYTR